MIYILVQVFSVVSFTTEINSGAVVAFAKYCDIKSASERELSVNLSC